ncbi:MAG: DcaP family trimeric outer membrane transporter [Candidatus Levyibacteriota bacterium]
MRNLDHGQPVPRPSLAVRAAGPKHLQDGEGRRRARFAATLLVLTALLLALVPRAHADELSDLKATIKKLEARVEALEAEKAAAPAAPVAPAAGEAKAAVEAVQPLPPSAAAPYVPPATLKSDEAAAQRVDNAPIDPSLKGFFKIPGTETMVKFGGYAKVDFIYDTKPISSYDYFVTSAIPTSGPDTQRGAQFTVHAKQTRLNVDMRRDTEAGPARLFFEGDWFGNASFGFDPGNYQLRLRHAFGQLENFGAGYSFSAFMDNDALPDTLDFEGPGAAPYLFVGAARYTWKAGKNTNFSLAAEAPSAEITAPIGTGKSTFPDITLRGRYEAEGGHFQAAGIWRRLGWRSGVGPSDSTNGYGLNLAGSLKTVGDDYLVAGGVWGKGIARYVSDITGSGLDAAVDSSGNLQALETYGGYGGYTHYWTPKLRSTGVIGYLGMNNKSFQSPTSFKDSQYYSANLIWNPAGSLNVGAEVLFGNYKTFDGNSANDTRIQLSVQYDFVR